MAQSRCVSIWMHSRRTHKIVHGSYLWAVELRGREGCTFYFRHLDIVLLDLFYDEYFLNFVVSKS